MNEFLGLEEKTINICRELKPIGKTRSNIDKFKAMEMMISFIKISM